MAAPLVVVVVQVVGPVRGGTVLAPWSPPVRAEPGRDHRQRVARTRILTVLVLTHPQWKDEAVVNEQPPFRLVQKVHAARSAFVLPDVGMHPIRRAVENASHRPDDTMANRDDLHLDVGVRARRLGELGHRRRPIRDVDAHVDVGLVWDVAARAHGAQQRAIGEHPRHALERSVHKFEEGYGFVAVSRN